MFPATVNIVSLSDVTLTMPGETGSSFREIADRKALFAARHSGFFTLADDSGLEVRALAGEPGIRSARYSGEPPDDARNRRLLLSRLQATPVADRAARFVCAISLALPNGELWTSDGHLEGTICDEERGTRGFGYDAIFLLPDGRTLGELLDEEKNTVSHRARAVKDILPFLLNQRLSRSPSSRASR